MQSYGCSPAGLGRVKSLLLGQAVSQVPLPEAETGVAVEFFLRPIEKFNEEDLPPLPDFPSDEEAKAMKAKTRAQIADTVMGPVRDRRGERG